MPTISMFYGILVLMYYRDNRQHHVRYQEDEAVVSISDGLLIAGSIPPKQLRLVQDCVEIHSEELQVDCQLAVNGEQPFRIAPLQ